MLIRFVVNNVLSFGEEKEFNMIPQARLRTHPHHKYNADQFPVLKMAAMYGANGAGKSNMVKALSMLKDVVVNEEIPARLRNAPFKFNPEPRPQSLGIEFIADGTPFFYGIELLEGIVQTEELYLSGLGKKDDVLIFERKTEDGQTTLTFSPEFEAEAENRMLKSILVKEFVRPHTSVFKLLAGRETEALAKVKAAFTWIATDLAIFGLDGLENLLTVFFHLTRNSHISSQEIIALLQSYDLGIDNFIVEKKEMKNISKNMYNLYIKYIGRNLEKNGIDFIANPESDTYDEFITYEESTLFVHKIYFTHKGVKFNFEEESDGTRKLIKFVPIIKVLFRRDSAVVIDEIEHSIHPLLIKELVRKFSADPETKGQLIFTTHESTLLDLDLFRQDEIWFAEKNEAGTTDLYSLSDFKEHVTIDIRKGYLSGRYGSIPFLGNLHDLHWHSHDLQEKV